MPTLLACFSPLVVVATLACLGSAVLRAQCEPTVIPGAGVPGTDGKVYALMPWDPDGAGPLGVHIVVAGSFTALVDRRATNLGLYDPATGTWQALGDPSGAVRALAVRANGNLLICGAFTSVGDVSAQRVAEFNGTVWSPLGSGIVSIGLGTGEVSSIVELPNGDVVAGGYFNNILGLPVGGIARFNGSSWQPMGTFTLGLGGLVVGPMSLCTLPNGDLVAGGLFTHEGTTTVNGLARWNGTNWSTFGTGPARATGTPQVTSVSTTPGGELLVGGSFDSVDGVNARNVARWNGTAWSPIGPGLVGGVWTLQHLPGGDLIAAGGLTILPGFLASPAARWNGTSWQNLGLGITSFHLFAITPLPNGSFLGGGDFQQVGGQPGRGLARWSTTAWVPVASGTAGTVRCVLSLRNGGTFAGGVFSHIAGVPAPGSAVHDGSAWNPIQLGTPSQAVEMPNGDIVGSLALSPFATHMRRWNGTSSSLIGIANGAVEALAASPAGDLVVGGSMTSVDAIATGSLATWNGITWAPRIPSFTGQVRDLVFLPDGNLAVAGTISMAGSFVGNVGIWDGTSWNTLAGGTSHPPTRLSVGPRGDLFASGIFSITGGPANPSVARWDGAGWTDLGGSFQPWHSLRALAALPNGDVLVGGVFEGAGAIAAENLARWDGAGWHAYGTGAEGPVDDLHAAPDGRIAIGGSFVRVNDVTSAAIARVQPTCPAPVVSYLAGCTQAGLALQLAIDTPAWGGGALRSVATSLPTTAVSLALYGVQPVFGNLGSLAPPIGIPGCFLLVQPDFVVPQFAIANASTHVLPVPDSPALTGAALFHQVLSLELGPAGAFVSLGSTRGFAVTIGAMW